MFGFEVQTVKSRNWEIEEEEDEIVVPVELIKPSITFNDSKVSKSDIDQFQNTSFNIIVSTKGSPSIFVRGCFESNQFDEIAELSYNDITPLKINTTILNNKCIIYRHKTEKSILFITVQYDVPADRCFSFVESIFNVFSKVDQVIILDKILNSHYLSQEYDHPIPPFTRVIYNSIFKNTFSFIPLESSNIIENLTASFLTICQIKNIPACSILNLYEPILNLESVQSFLPIVKSIYPQLFNDLNQTDITNQFKLMISSVNKRNDRGIYI